MLLIPTAEEARHQVEQLQEFLFNERNPMALGIKKAIYNLQTSFEFSIPDGDPSIDRLKAEIEKKGYDWEIIASKWIASQGISLHTIRISW